MDEKIHVEFSEEEFDLIMKYMEATEAVTVHAAIINMFLQQSMSWATMRLQIVEIK